MINEQELMSKILVFTGELPDMTRKDAKTFAETVLGAKVAGSVTKQTNIVIAGTDAGAKLERAQELGVTIVPGEDFVTMVKRIVARSDLAVMEKIYVEGEPRR
jgi:DNA ligase (NAD+)